MKLLVTGGAGFIGCNFCRYMLNKYKNYKIVCLDALTYAGNLENLKDILNNKNFKFVKGNICNKKLVDNLFKQENFDIVINFAAESHVDRSIKNSNKFLKSNVMGVQILLDACKKYNIKRFHQVSTDEVYGDLPLTSRKKFTENSPLKPSNPYSATKAMADLLVLSYYKTFNLPITISRSSNNFGYFQHSEKFIPKIILNALKNKKIYVYGNGENVRDWIFVIDNCRAIDLIIHKGIVGEIYNISVNNEIKNIDIVKKILDILKKPYSKIKFVLDRQGHDLKYSLDTKKIQYLGFIQNCDFENYIKKTVEWYKNNK